MNKIEDSIIEISKFEKDQNNLDTLVGLAKTNLFAENLIFILPKQNRII